MTLPRQHPERGGGAITAPVAAAMIVIFAVIGLAVDGTRKAQAITTADAIAEEAARAGGQAIRPAQLASGTISLDTPAAVTAAQTYLATTGATGTVTVLGPDRIRVQVTTTRPTVLLGLLGVNEVTAHGSAEALLVPVPSAGTPP